MQVVALLEANKPVREGEFSTPEVDMIISKLGHLITSKPVVYLVNLTEKVRRVWPCVSPTNA